jgi:hypothetical protein
MPRTCRLLTPAEQIKAVERKVGHKLSRTDRLDVVEPGQEYICTPVDGGLGRRPVPPRGRRGRRRR